jgi:hypothetical protein
MKHCHLEDGVWIITCPICGSTRPSVDGQPDGRPIYCNFNCYYIGHRFDPPTTQGGDGSTIIT